MEPIRPHSPQIQQAEDPQAIPVRPGAMLDGLGEAGDRLQAPRPIRFQDDLVSGLRGEAEHVQGPLRIRPVTVATDMELAEEVAREPAQQDGLFVERESLPTRKADAALGMLLSHCR